MKYIISEEQSLLVISDLRQKQIKLIESKFNELSSNEK